MKTRKARKVRKKGRHLRHVKKEGTKAHKHVKPREHVSHVGTKVPEARNSAHSFRTVWNPICFLLK